MMSKRYVFELKNLPRQLGFPLKLSAMGYIENNFYALRKVTEQNILIGFFLRSETLRSCRIENGQTVRQLRHPPEMAFTAPGVTHWSETNSPWDELYFSYAPDQMACMESLGLSIRKLDGKRIRVYNPDRLQRQIDELLKLCSEIHLPGTPDRLDLAAFAMVMSHLTAEDCGPETDSAVRNIAAYIRRHFMSRFDIRELAMKHGMSYSTFYREWHKEFEIPVHAYTMTLRLNFAKQLLLTTTYTLKEIAEECGFSSAIDLCHSFKKHLKTTPGEFRRQ